MKKGFLNMVIALVVVAFALPGCAEQHYYHQYHHHSPEYYHRHHQEPPPGIDINIHN